MSRDAALAKTLGLNGTPAFLVGLLRDDGQAKVTDAIGGARPLRTFMAALDKALSSVPAE